MNRHCPQAQGEKLQAHMQNTLYVRMKKMGLFGQGMQMTEKRQKGVGYFIHLL